MLWWYLTTVSSLQCDLNHQQSHNKTKFVFELIELFQSAESWSYGMIKNSQSNSIKYTVIRVHVHVHSNILAIKHSILDRFLSL